eukprot:12139290-Alexandrium_andersonii.AAC.1
MSASLVGSEMCIRDRRSSPPAYSAALPTPVGAGQNLESKRCGVSPRRAYCLLYTSDAADDM